MAINASRKESAARGIFDVGINDSLPAGQLLVLGLQNVFGMTGMFVFPGLLGRSFNLPPEKIAYLYGMTFAVCGVITVLQSVLLLRLPIIQGPYAGSFAAILAVGHLQGGGLGAAYGSFFVASLVWCALDAAGEAIQFHRTLCAISSRADYFRDDRDAGDHPNLQCGAAELDRRSLESWISRGEHSGGRSCRRSGDLA